MPGREAIPAANQVTRRTILPRGWVRSGAGRGESSELLEGDISLTGDTFALRRIAAPMHEADVDCWAARARRDFPRFLRPPLLPSAPADRHGLGRPAGRSGSGSGSDGQAAGVGGASGPSGPP